MSFMDKAQQREADIDAIAHVIFEWKFAGPHWTEWDVAKGSPAWSAEVTEARSIAQNILASSWLDEKLEDARQDGFSDGVDSAGYM